MLVEIIEGTLIHVSCKYHPFLHDIHFIIIYIADLIASFDPSMEDTVNEMDLMGELVVVLSNPADREVSVSVTTTEADTNPG